MKVLVTGGAGFIGSHLVEELYKQGHEVISIDNYCAGKKENLQHLKGKITEIECDILDDKIEEYIKGIDWIFHQAASKKTICLKDPIKDLEVNGKGTLKLLKLSVKHNIKKFIHASTGSVYGKCLIKPQTEDHPLNPTSYYGVSKLTGEKYVTLFNELYNLDTVILRYYHVYGTRQESGEFGGVVSIFNRLLNENKPIIIYGDGSQERSFTYVKDVVNANILAANSNYSGKIYNCASCISVTVKQLAEYICKIKGKENYPIIYKDWQLGDIKYFFVDNSKIVKDLGIVFEKDIIKGLEKVIHL